MYNPPNAHDKLIMWTWNRLQERPRKLGWGLEMIVGMWGIKNVKGQPFYIEHQMEE